MIKTKWLIYTVIIGLIPLFVRGIIYIGLKNANLNYIFNSSDMVLFGLVLHLSNINELEDNIDIDRVWKTACIGTSVISIVIFSVILVVTYFSEINDIKLFDIGSLKKFIGIFCLASFGFSYMIFNRLNLIKS